MKKILVIRFGAMGDLLHVSPSLAFSQQSTPIHFHILTSPMYQPLVKKFQGVSEVWTYDKQAGWKGLWKLAQKLKQQQFDGVVNLHPSFRTWLLTQWIGVRQKALYQKQKFRVSGEALRQLPRRHAVEDFYVPFQQLLGLPSLTKENFIPQLELGRQAVQDLKIGIIPGVGKKRSNRAWPLEEYKALVEELLKRYPQSTLYIIGGPEERHTGNQLASSERVVNTCGTFTILETGELLSECALVVGGDTGPLHLAASVGAPTVAIFGPTALQRTGPVATQKMICLAPTPELACWPCEKPTCPFTEEKELACMRSIDLKNVLQACQKILEKRAC